MNKLYGYPTEQQIAAILLKKKLNPEDAKVWKYKYVNLRVSVPKRGVECYLTFDQYTRLAVRAGLTKPDQIGKKPHLYQMSRRGDTGDYEWGNCRFLTMKANLEEKRKNGGLARAAEKMTGRSKDTHEYLARMAADMVGKNKENDWGRMQTSIKLSGRTAKTHKYLADRASKRGHEFTAVSPRGKVYVGRNLAKFCREHNLDQNALRNTLRGLRIHHLGWTGSLKEKS